MTDYHTECAHWFVGEASTCRKCGAPKPARQLPEEHYHYATDGPPGRRTAPPCHCDTPARPIRPVDTGDGWTVLTFDGARKIGVANLADETTARDMARTHRALGFTTRVRPALPPLRTSLLAQLGEYGFAALAELEHLGPRTEVIAELARMRDDGLVEFKGPRYRITQAGLKLAETGSN